MKFNKIKKLNLGIYPTPVEHLVHLSEVLGGPQIYIKRDDYTGIALGGNKVRKLEYLMADAMSKGADTVITTGGPQSNHARITAGICAKLGLKSVLVLAGEKPKNYEGNLLLDSIFGAEIIFVGKKDFDSEIPKIMEKIQNHYKNKGCNPYLIPLGGANPMGCLGYVKCMEEIKSQIEQQNLKIDYIITADGSGGTHAGLEIGKIIYGINTEIIGISVLFPKKIIQRRIINLTKETDSLLDIKPNSFEISVYDKYIGKGYAIPTKETLEAISLLGKEGIVLDPVYTGKAMGGLIDLVKKKKFTKDDNILFLHTGGHPGLFGIKK